MGALLAEMVDIEMNDVAIEALAKIKQRQVHHTANQSLLAKLEETFESDADHNETNNQRERFEAIVGQEFIDVLLGNQIQIQLSAGTGKPTFEFCQVAGQIANALIVAGGSALDFLGDSIHGNLVAADIFLGIVNFHLDPVVQGLLLSQTLQDRVNRS